MSKVFPSEIVSVVSESAIDYFVLDSTERDRPLTVMESFRLGVAAVNLIVYGSALFAYAVESVMTSAQMMQEVGHHEQDGGCQSVTSYIY